MANISLKILLFFAGLLTFGTGAAYFAGAFNPAIKEGGDMATAPPAAVPDAATSSKAASKKGGRSSTGEGTREPEVREEADASRDSGKPRQEVVIPSFDVLRVEPDGSMVVAGRAAPGAEIEVLSGSSVLATTKAGPAGDFAAVLDQPLKPGEHNIVLRGTSSDNVAATSVETAVVAIPSDDSGQVVALVQQPGEPSRLITAPAAETPGADESTAADEKQARQTARAEDEAAQMPSRQRQQAAPAPAQAEEPADRQAAEAGEAGGQAGSQAADAGEKQPQEETALEEQPGPASEDQPQETAADDRPAPATEDRPRETAASDRSAPATDDRPQETAADDRPGSATEDRPQETAAAPAARQEEGDKPARAAEADTPAAPDIPAEAEPEDAGPAPFIEAVEIDGREVFVAGTAEPGRRVRVYANDVLLGQTTVNPDGTFLVETERALPIGDYIIRADVLDDDGATVIARAAVPFQRQEGERIAAVAPERSEAAQAKAKVKAQSEAQADEGAADPSMDATAGGGSRTPVQAESGSDEHAMAKAGEAVGMEGPASTSAGGDIPQLAPALEPAEGAVIIRRGDTLWHISRRVYGRGIRYTTIYLANQDQIRDPDLIWPGQTFTLPERTEEGEEADLSAIDGQAVSPEEMAREAGE